MTRLISLWLMVSTSLSLLALPPWTANDTKTEAAYLALHTADWLQSLEIADNPERWHECNPILGRHPSRGQVNRYFLGTAIAHVVLARVLPPRPRHWFQGLTLGVEAGCVGNNLSIGIKVRL